MDGASFARHYGDAFGWLFKLVAALLVVVLVLGSWIAWDWFTSPSRSDFEREAVKAGAAEFRGDGTGGREFRWINAKEVEDHWFKVGFENGEREANEILRDQNYLRPIPAKGATPESEFERGSKEGAERVRKLVEDMGIELPAQ